MERKQYKKIMKNGVRKAEHQWVWIDNFGEIPKGYDIHHIDLNHLNNDISNLQLMTHSEHMRLHMIGNKKQKPKGYKWNNPMSEEVRKKISESTKGIKKGYNKGTSIFASNRPRNEKGHFIKINQ